MGLAVIRQGNRARGGKCLAVEFHARNTLTDMAWIFDCDYVEQKNTTSVVGVTSCNLYSRRMSRRIQRPENVAAATHFQAELPSETRVAPRGDGVRLQIRSCLKRRVGNE